MKEVLLGPPVSIVNNIDQSTPSLNFEFINEYVVLSDKVIKTDADAVTGCGHVKHDFINQTCRPNMGQYRGCEYSRACECLEFAAIDLNRLQPEDEERLRDNPDDHMGLPKRFPYGSPISSSEKLLVPFYLDERHPIYECNFRCKCGEGCKTRLVQFGRKIPLTIFKTKYKGWGKLAYSWISFWILDSNDLTLGLTSPVFLRRGQFIDTYRGEIITDDEATQRDEKVKGKASYLYNLDKHIGDGGLQAQDCFTVDGEHYGGPTRFMNHSCNPNVRQYTVSYNRYDLKVYDLAFFATRDIQPHTELTFDYLDKNEESEDEEGDYKPLASQETIQGDAIECKCGSANCRKILWR